MPSYWSSLSIIPAQRDDFSQGSFGKENLDKSVFRGYNRGCYLECIEIEPLWRSGSATVL